MNTFQRKTFAIIKDQYGNSKSIGELIELDKTQFDLIKKQLDEIKIKEDFERTKEIKNIKSTIEVIDTNIKSFLLKSKIQNVYSLYLLEVFNGDEEENKNIDELKDNVYQFIKGESNKLKLSILPNRFIELLNLYGISKEEIGE